MVNVTASYSPKHFLLKALSNLLDLCLVNSKILYFWQVLESIHKFIIELHTLLCLFVRGYNKQQRNVRIISNFTKGLTFFISYDNQVLLGVISQQVPLLAPYKKELPLVFSLDKKIIYLDTQLKEESVQLPGYSLFPQVE